VSTTFFYRLAAIDKGLPFDRGWRAALAVYGRRIARLGVTVIGVLIMGAIYVAASATAHAGSKVSMEAVWAGVTGVSALVTGSVAILTLRALRQDSLDRTRPVIVVEVLPVVLSHGTSELVVQNVGQSVAKHVRLTFDPPITEDMGQMAAFLARRYSQTIPTMAPGRRLTNIYAHWVGDGSDNLAEPVPKQFAATAVYVDAHGRVYEDSYELSLQTLRNQTTSSPSNTDPAGIQKRLVQALEAIARGVNRG
jgi:hypothetical protein